MACGAWQANSQIVAGIINLTRLVNSIGGEKAEFLEPSDVNPYESTPIERQLTRYRISELQRIKTLPVDERPEARRKLAARLAQHESGGD